MLIDRIVFLRDELKISQEEFAKKIGVSRNFISLVETGKRNISDRTIADICREFKVNEIWLREGVGEPFVKNNREKEISEFLSDLLKAEPDDIRLRIVGVLARLTIEDWEFIEKRLLRLVEESNESK